MDLVQVYYIVLLSLISLINLGELMKSQDEGDKVKAEGILIGSLVGILLQIPIAGRLFGWW